MQQPAGERMLMLPAKDPSLFGKSSSSSTRKWKGQKKENREGRKPTNTRSIKLALVESDSTPEIKAEYWQLKN